MGVDGSYYADIKTPIGVKSGTLTLITNGEKLDGNMTDTDGHVANFHEGAWVKGNEFSCEFKMKVPFSSVLVVLNCRIEGDKCLGTAKTPFGLLDVDGTRV
ncbi:hypothetical protein LPY66_08130 [Dehalobacter sp. DCM]|uniref:hypothetical protein n=1 Tax=Dehalobacter sp. DCM TaxID=2907827 RepID=UPI0030818C35|nr:hypothetical protein LPY66_08130 [Dehalobacter sp. DCM]